MSENIINIENSICKQFKAPKDKVKMSTSMWLVFFFLTCPAGAN